MHVGIAIPARRGETFPVFRCMRKPQFYVSGKRPMGLMFWGVRPRHFNRHTPYRDLKKYQLILQNGAMVRRAGTIIGFSSTSTSTCSMCEYEYESDYLIIITLRPRQNGRHFADDIFKRIFLNKKLYKLRLRFHWNLFLRVQLTIFQHWFR